MKHSANRAVIEGKRVVLVDDSVVRGTTSKQIVQMMRDAGAREVHFRSASPQILFGDFYGIDMPDVQQLLAAQATRAMWRPWRNGSTPTASASSPSMASMPPMGLTRDPRVRRNSPITVSPAIIPRASWTSDDLLGGGREFQPSLLSEPEAA